MWNQQPSNYKHTTQKPQSTSSHVSIRRHQSSASRRPLCTPGQSASNLLSSESIQSVEQPLDKAAAVANRRNVYRTQPAETQSDGVICSKLESCGLMLLWTETSQTSRPGCFYTSSVFLSSTFTIPHSTAKLHTQLWKQSSILPENLTLLLNAAPHWRTNPQTVNRSQIRWTEEAESNATNRILPHLPRIHLSGSFSIFQSCSHYTDKNVDSDGNKRFGLVDTEIGCLREHNKWESGTPRAVPSLSSKTPSFRDLKRRMT